MKNTAEVYAGTLDVQLHIRAVPDTAQWFILTLVNMLALLFTGFIISLVFSTDSFFRLLLSVVILPGLYLFSLGRVTLWTLAGEELICFSKGQVSRTRDFRLFRQRSEIIREEFAGWSIVETETIGEQTFARLELYRQGQGAELALLCFSTGLKAPVSQLQQAMDHLPRLPRLS